MCTVSMITDYWRDKWPQPTVPYPLTLPYQQFPPMRTITEAEWQDYQSLKLKALEYDKRTGQPDCEKPEVEEWERRMEDFLKRKGLLTNQEQA